LPLDNRNKELCNIKYRERIMNNEELKTLERKLFLQYFEFVLEGGDMVFLKKTNQSYLG